MNNKMIDIGILHTPITDKATAPIQSSRSELTGLVEVFPQFAEGLEGIDGFSHIYLLYGFHQSDPVSRLTVQPFLDDQVHGVFACRYPCRPNPLGLSVVRLLERRGNLLEVNGVDMLDGTPLWDIKPYIPEFDVFSVEKSGWYSNRKYT